MSNRYTLFSVLLASLTLVACNPSDEGTGVKASPSAAPAAGAATTPAAHDGRKVEISADDTMKFSVLELRASAAERLSVTLVNKGTTPKFSMGHNWVLLAATVDVDKFLLAAAEAATTEYVPAANPADILASTKLLGPGERDSTTFSAPSTPGRYVFLCSFPGHAQVGMRGVLIVE